MSTAEATELTDIRLTGADRRGTRSNSRRGSDEEVQPMTVLIDASVRST